jgi:hypothetical protein
MKHEPGMAYDTKKLNKVFAFLSVIFLISVVWMMLDDFIRPWKVYQIQAVKIRREVLKKQLEEADKKLNKEELNKLKADLAKAEEHLKSKKGDLDSQTKAIDILKGQIYEEKMKNGSINAIMSETTFKFEIAEDGHSPKALKLKENLDRYKMEFALSKDRLKALQAELADKKLAIEHIEKEVSEAKKALDKVNGARERLLASVEKTKLGPIDLLRNLPFIDYLDPTIKIQQIVLENVTDDRYFQQVPKVDRCTTCHTFIDQVGFEEQKQPFKTHPKLDLMVGINSPHPMKSIGCTSCHGGEGHRVNDLKSAAHMPQNQEQQERWIKEYQWKEPHKVPSTMLKLQFAEASCVKCHQGSDFIPQATVLNEGRQIIRDNGCYACHKIEGWEHLQRPGPSLLKVAAKLDKNFVKNWIWSPTHFNKKKSNACFFQSV